MYSQRTSGFWQSTKWTPFLVLMLSGFAAYYTGWPLWQGALIMLGSTLAAYFLVHTLDKIFNRPPSAPQTPPVIEKMTKPSEPAKKPSTEQTPKKPAPLLTKVQEAEFAALKAKADKEYITAMKKLRTQSKQAGIAAKQAKNDSDAALKKLSSANLEDVHGDFNAYYKESMELAEKRAVGAINDQDLKKESEKINEKHTKAWASRLDLTPEKIARPKR